MRIFQAHLAEFLWRRNLNWNQKLHYVLGWLPWASHGLHPIFFITTLYWSIRGAINYYYILPVFALVPLFIYTLTHVICTTLTYRLVMQKDWSTVARVIVAQLALVPTIASGVIASLFHTRYPFTFTNKEKNKKIKTNETLIAVAHVLNLLSLATLAILLSIRWDGHPVAVTFSAILIVMGLPSLCFMVMLNWSLRR